MKKRWDKLPVEPLEGSSWERIERRLEATETVPPVPLRVGRPRSWVFVAVTAAAACGAFAAWFVSQKVGESGLASRVVTDAAGSRVVAGDVTLEVGPWSALRVDGDLHVVLEKGRVVCDVAPRGQRAPVVVEAGDVTVRVIGTRFAVWREGASARVEVEHGVVEVRRKGQSARLIEGEKWPLAAVETPAPAAPEPAVPEPAAPEPPAAHKPPPPRHVPPKPTPAPSARERYEAAARLEASDPDAARAIYAELAHGDDPWAQNALFAQARLAHERGRPDEAARLCRQYLARFPSGANAPDAREMLDRKR